MYDQDIANDIGKKRREINAAGWTLGANLALIPIVPPAIVGAAIAGRSVQIARDKLVVLQEEWWRRGHRPIPYNIVRDGLGPVAVAAATSGALLGLDMGFAAAASGPISHAGYAGAEQVANGLVNGQGFPPGFTHQFEDGAWNGIQQGVGVFSGTGFAVNPGAHQPAYNIGDAVGFAAVHEGANRLIQKFGDEVQGQVARLSFHVRSFS